MTNGKAKADGKKENGKGHAQHEAPKKQETKKNDYGFRVGSKADLFLESVLKGKKGISMEEVKALPWNENKATYFGYAARLIKQGAIKRDEGKFYPTK